MNNIRIFAKTIEHEVYNQVKELSTYEAYQNSKIRLMPDCHVGKGCTVGTTMTITDKVTPNLVGVDISCGMLCVELNIKELSNEELIKLDNIIREYIPHGQNIHTNKPKTKFDDLEKLKCIKHIDAKRALYSIGSLGGGNHFIEVAKGNNNDNLYLIIHSGSRKLGVDVCKYYQNKAYKKLNEVSSIKNDLIKKLKAEGREKDINKELKKVSKPKCNKELAHLEGVDFDNYIHDMKILQKYASLNRNTMADIIIKQMKLCECNRFETVHNYIDIDRMILRKGAISANLGELVLIPMNMRDGSLLCVGKGNEDWNYSAPHGAGRLFSRSKAKEKCNIDDYKKSMEGIFTTSVNESTIDESPSVYKCMDEIIECIEPTVDILDILKPIYNFKSN